MLEKAPADPNAKLISSVQITCFVGGWLVSSNLVDGSQNVVPDVARVHAFTTFYQMSDYLKTLLVTSKE